MEENQTNVEINVDELLQMMKKTIREFINGNRDNLGALSIETGIDGNVILDVIYHKNISIIHMIRLYNTVADRINKGTNVLLAKIEEAKALDIVLKEIKVKVDTNNVGAVSSKTGISTDEILKIKYGLLIPNLEVAAKIRNGVILVQNENSQKIIDRNHLFTPETEKELNQKLKEIRDYVRPNPSVVWDLADESENGLTTDEIYEISYGIDVNKVQEVEEVKEFELVKIRNLFDAVHKLIDIRNQPLIDQINASR